MRVIIPGLAFLSLMAAPAVAQSDSGPQPTCTMCEGVYVPAAEIAAYSKKAVAEHDQVSEVYHILDGSATLKVGPRLVNKKRRPADEETVRLYNGPGNNSDDIEGGVSYDLKPGDVVFIPAGTGHLFSHIDDHIDYIMVRIDPDKITPLKDEAASKAYLGDPSNKR
jgi:mannose-6-phosphate isomerase-like protein (cupin superfamily)